MAEEEWNISVKILCLAVAKKLKADPKLFENVCLYPGSNFFGKTPLFFRYSGVNAANAVNLQAKRR